MSEEKNVDKLSGYSQSYLSFNLSEEHFTIPVMKVMEILEVPKITKVPQAPSFIVGVINLRGAVLPVIDTRIKFGMDPIEYTVNTCILVMTVEINEESIVVGALVDSVLEVFELDESAIKASPSIATKFRAGYIKGMIQENDRFMMVLDIDKVFSSSDLDNLAITSEVTPVEH
jgi:purine-binding chemotaxis protein CheW